MPTREQTLKQMEDTGIVAVIRAPSSEHLLPLAEALVAGGVTCIEITMSTPNAIAGIEQLSKKLGTRATIGVGTVIIAAKAAEAIRAGAEFVVSPFTDEQIIRTVTSMGKVMVPGAYTPTEIMRAASLGGDVIKVFPSTSLGPQYFKDILTPLPQLRLTPTGGVDLSNVGNWLKAGAVCVGVGTALVNKEAMAKQDWAGVTASAKAFTDAIKTARQQ